jgi:DNA-binding ferritin-like protein
MDLDTALQELFATNFVAYYRAHVAHVNVVGRNFVSDHKMLGKIYEDLQGAIDPIAEIIRTRDAFMPVSLAQVLSNSDIEDSDVEGSADDLISTVLADQLELIEIYREVVVAAEEQGIIEIANYAQDRLLKHDTYVWQLRSILEE